MIAIPDSVAFYWRDPINRAAVNVLDDIAQVPSDLSLQEAERFELAHLTARRVRVEYWRLLRALWSATWGQAVRASIPHARLLNYGEHLAFAAEVEVQAELSVDSAWMTRAAAGVYDVGAGRCLFTRFALIESEREVSLAFYIRNVDGSCNISDEIDLGPDWIDDGDSRRVTRLGLLPLSVVDASIDPAAYMLTSSIVVASLAATL